MNGTFSCLPRAAASSHSDAYPLSIRIRPRLPPCRIAAPRPTPSRIRSQHCRAPASLPVSVPLRWPYTIHPTHVTQTHVNVTKPAKSQSIWVDLPSARFVSPAPKGMGGDREDPWQRPVFALPMHRPLPMGDAWAMHGRGIAKEREHPVMRRGCGVLRPARQRISITYPTRPEYRRPGFGSGTRSPNCLGSQPSELVRIGGIALQTPAPAKDRALASQYLWAASCTES